MERENLQNIFRSMLNSKFCEGSPPVLQINDIRYEIFEMVRFVLFGFFLKTALGLLPLSLSTADLLKIFVLPLLLITVIIIIIIENPHHSYSR